MKSFFSAIKSSIAAVAQPTSNNQKAQPSKPDNSAAPAPAAGSSNSQPPPSSAPPATRPTSSSISIPSKPAAPTSSAPLSHSAPVPTDFYRIAPKYVKQLSSDLFAISSILFDHSKPIQNEIEEFVRLFEPILTKAGETTAAAEKFRDLPEIGKNEEFQSLVSELSATRLIAAQSVESGAKSLADSSQKFDESQDRLKKIRAEMNKSLQETWEENIKNHEKTMAEIKEQKKKEKTKNNENNNNNSSNSNSSTAVSSNPSTDNVVAPVTASNVTEE